MKELQQLQPLQPSYVQEHVSYYHRITTLRVVLFLVIIMSGFVSGCGSTEPTLISVGDRQIRTGVSENPTEEMTASKEDFNPAVEDTTEVTTSTAISYVDVCGAVNNPGVYALPTGSRVYEAIELAGGFTKEASRDSCNQAECVTDGEQIKILTMTEATIVQAEEVRSQAEAEQAEAGIVNINTAQVSQLTTLPGIGNSRAEDIIAYRNANGAFQKIEDILQVTGIKEGIYLKLKDKITVS